MSAEIIEAQLGQEARDFLETDLGKLFIARAEQDEQAAIQNLITLDPYKFNTLIDLQNAIMAIQQEFLVGNRITRYLNDAIVNGDVAWQNLTAKEEV